jgi:surface antigen
MKKIFIAVLALGLSFQSINAEAKNNKQAGKIIGVIGGGLIAHDLSNGNGVATLIGMIVGGAIGSEIGAEMDAYDRSQFNEAQRYGLYYGNPGYTSSWRGNNYYGDFVVIRTGGYYSGYNCRSYRSEIYSYSTGRREIRSGTTCQYPNGWREVSETYVLWGN